MSACTIFSSLHFPLVGGWSVFQGYLLRRDGRCASSPLKGIRSRLKKQALTSNLLKLTTAVPEQQTLERNGSGIIVSIIQARGTKVPLIFHTTAEHSCFGLSAVLLRRTLEISSVPMTRETKTLKFRPRKCNP